MAAFVFWPQGLPCTAEKQIVLISISGLACKPFAKWTEEIGCRSTSVLSTCLIASVFCAFLCHHAV